MEKAGKKTSPFLAVTLKNSAVLALIEKSHFVDLPTRTKTCKKRYLLSSFEMNRILCYLEAGVFSLPLYFFFSLPMDCMCLWWKLWTRDVQWYIQ